MGKQKIRLNATPKQKLIISQIAQRAKQLLNVDDDVAICIEMDITATHLNACELRLKELLQADSFNFLHDVTGIHKHLNRETGQLEHCFLPRFARYGVVSNG